jgi:hypothetical protein
MPEFLRVEDLILYQKMCDLHLEVCDVSRGRSAVEKYELESLVRRSSNSDSAQLAEKPSDRHVRNKVAGTNHARRGAGNSSSFVYRVAKAVPRVTAV